MVPRRGLEPPRPCERQHLKLVRLPIPPSGHGVGEGVYGGRYVLSTIPASNLPFDPSNAVRCRAGGSRVAGCKARSPDMPGLEAEPRAGDPTGPDSRPGRLIRDRGTL